MAFGPRLVFRWGCACLAAMTLAACGALEPKPNVLLISIDTLRSDHTSVDGYARQTTPTLEILAAGGVRFEQAYSPAASTGPSHATLLTGRHPISHGVVRNGLILSDGHETLAEVLSAHGYQTWGAVGSFVLDPRFGYSQGFDRYDASFARATVPQLEWWGHDVERFDRRASEVTDVALGWLRSARDPARPFLLFLHYFDPHWPYGPPGEYGLRFLESDVERGTPAHEAQLYDGEIAYVDSQIGRVLEALDELGLADDTLVVVTADHGEGLGDHGVKLHSIHLFEEAVRVPLLVRWPGVLEPGRVVSEPVGGVDLMPTLLALAGVAVEEAPLEGLSLVGAITGAAPLDPERAVFLHRRPARRQQIEGVWVHGPKYGIRVGDWKYFEAPELPARELYDLRRDPGETTNLLGRNPEVANRMASLLADWRERFEVPRAVEAIPDDARRGLEALGYVE